MYCVIVLYLELQGKDMYLILENDMLNLIDPMDRTVLHSQPIVSIRVWGVGRDNGRWVFALVCLDLVLFQPANTWYTLFCPRAYEKVGKSFFLLLVLLFKLSAFRNVSLLCCFVKSALSKPFRLTQVHKTARVTLICSRYIWYFLV